MIKTFKIGECAIGGIIKVEIPQAKKTVYKVSALDWDSGELVTWSYCYSKSDLISYLEELSTPYYADAIVNKVESILAKKNTHSSLSLQTI